MELLGTLAALVLSALLVRDARVFARSFIALKAARESTIGRDAAPAAGTGRRA